MATNFAADTLKSVISKAATTLASGVAASDSAVAEFRPHQLPSIDAQDTADGTAVHAAPGLPSLSDSAVAALKAAYLAVEQAIGDTSSLTGTAATGTGTGTATTTAPADAGGKALLWHDHVAAWLDGSAGRSGAAGDSDGPAPADSSSAAASDAGDAVWQHHVIQQDAGDTAVTTDAAVVSAVGDFAGLLQSPQLDPMHGHAADPSHPDPSHPDMAA